MKNSIIRALLLVGAFILTLPTTGRASSALEKVSYWNLTLEEALDVELIVGTRSSGRKAVESPVPIEVISGSALRKTGMGEFTRALQRIASSINVSHATVHDADDHVRSFSLRGMGNDQVLVLLNGKRLHHSALVHPFDNIGRGASGVDINTISIEAVERVEILRGAAAAQYGSDAIAGIINIVLKETLENSVTVNVGKTSKGDGELARVALNSGLNLKNKGFAQFTAEFRKRQQTNRAGIDQRQYYFDDDPRNDDPSLSNQVTFRIGDPEGEDFIGMFNGRLNLTEGRSLYSVMNINQRKSEAAGFFRPPQDDRNVRLIYPNGFLPLITVDILDYYQTFGYKSDNEAKTSWDLSASIGQNTLQYKVRDSLNTSLGATSPTSFDIGTLKNFQYLSNLDFHRNFDLAWANPLSFGTGFEIRQERYQISSGEAASYENGGIAIIDGPNAGQLAHVGSQVLPGFSPSNQTDERRTNVSYYVDVENKLNEFWLTQVASRYEYYDDFGSTLNGKVAASYAPIRPWVFRMAASTGFRAPSLSQSTFTSSITALANETDLLELSHLPVSNPVARSLGARELEPEKSVHYGIGTSFIAKENLTFTLDLFWITVTDRIVKSGNINKDLELFGQTVVDILEKANLGSAAFMTNAIDLKNRGFDVNVSYSRDSSIGRLLFNTSYHKNDVKITGKVDTPDILGPGATEIIFNRIERVRVEDGQPEDNLIFSLNIRGNKIESNVRLIRFGEYSRAWDVDDLSQDENYGADWISDFDFSYHYDANITASIGVHNLFDNYPDFAKRDQNANLFLGREGIFRYPFNAPFGINGRFYYLKLNYIF